MDELEAGLSVVIQSAHHARINLISYAHIIQHAGYGLEMLAAFRIKVVEHQGGIDKLLLDLRTLIIQHTQRIDLSTVAGLVIQIEFKEELLQLLPVSRAAIAIA